MNWQQIGENILSFLIELGTSVGLKLLFALVIIIVGSKLVSFLIKRLRKGKFSKRLETSVANFLINLINVALRTLIFITAATVLGIPATSFVALVTSAGVAIGLALQGSLANLAGGVMILIFRPFRVGDYILGAGEEGTVEEITIFYTTLVTPDNKVIHCPNGALSNANVTNYSEKKTRRVEVIASCAYGSDVEQVKRLLTEVASSHPLVLESPAPFVRLKECADSSLNVTVRVWCNNGDYWTVFYDLTERFQATLEANGIEIPFPQMDVHVKND